MAEVRTSSDRGRRRGSAAPPPQLTAPSQVTLPAELTDAACDAWSTMRCELAEQLPTSTFGFWFEPLDVVGEFEDALVLTGPTHARRWVARRYPDLLRFVLHALTDFDGIRFVAQPPPADREGVL